MFHNSLHVQYGGFYYDKIFEYCPPCCVESEIDKLVNLFNQVSSDVKTVQQAIHVAAWLHYCFILIHPFQDGNGRVARLLVSLFFISNGLPPLHFYLEDKSFFLAALKVADETKDLTHLAKFFEYCLFAIGKDVESILSVDWRNITQVKQTLTESRKKNFNLLHQSYPDLVLRLSAYESTLTQPK